MGEKIEDPTPDPTPDPEPSYYRPESELLPLMAELTGADSGFTGVELEGEYQTLARVYKENGGSGYVAYVAVLSANYEGVVESEALIYITNNLKISAIKKLTFKTSDAIYGYVPPTAEAIDEFYGRLPNSTISSIDGVELVSNATNTSTNVINSIKEALGAIEELVAADMPTAEETVLGYATELVGGQANLEDLTPDQTKYVKRIYKDKNGKGYVAYVVVISENYGTVESESLIHVSNSGKISGIKKITFKTSDAIYGYVPPTVEQIDAFYSRLPGLALSTIDSVELVSNATNTSTNAVNSIKEALTAIADLIAADMPTAEETVIEYAEALIGGECNLVNVTPEGNVYVKRIYKDEMSGAYIAYVVVISENYGTVESESLIHVTANGKIKGIKKITFKTSDAIYGYVPPTVEAIDEFYGRLPNNSLSSIDSVELVSNATNTSTNAVNSIKEALGAIEALVAADMPTPESDILTLAGQLIEGADFKNVTPDNTKYVKRIYKDKNGKGYVAYVLVISENYGTVESESLIHIGNDGKIKGIKKITFKTSDAIYGYVPPTAEAIDAFYARLPGLALSTIDSVELVSNATNTSTNAVNSIKEALGEVDSLIKKDMPTSDADLYVLAEALVGEKLDLERVDIKNATYVRRVYKDKNGNGFIAYVVVISENYGTVESESLIHIGNDGKIKGIKKITFKTSDAIYGYVPPTSEAIDAFYARLVGKSTVTIDGVELVSNATNTSTNAVNAIKEALAIVDEILPENNIPRIIGIAALVAAIISFVTVAVIIRKKRGGKCDE